MFHLLTYQQLRVCCRAGPEHRPEQLGLLLPLLRITGKVTATAEIKTNQKQTRTVFSSPWWRVATGADSHPAA